MPFRSFGLLSLLSGFLLLVCGCEPQSPTKSASSLSCEADSDCLTGYQCKEKKCALCMACLPSGDQRCDTLQSFQVCQALPNGCTFWGASTPCSAGQSCSLGRCTAAPTEVCRDLCIHGDRRCVEGVPYLCDSKDGCTSWFRQTSCPPPESCNEGRCVTAPSQGVPSITFFKAEHLAAFPKEPVKLEWRATSAERVLLKPLNLSLPSAGEIIVSDESSVTYTLEALSGSQSSQKTLTVERTTSPPTRIHEFRIVTDPNSPDRASVRLKLLTNEVLCLPEIEVKYPNGTVVSKRMGLLYQTFDYPWFSASNGYSFVEYSFGLPGLSAPSPIDGMYRVRTRAYTTSDPFDCSSPVKKEYFYPEKTENGERGWIDFLLIKETKCPQTSCKSGEARCQGNDYQLCETTSFQCGVWSPLLSCPSGSKCFANGGCLPIDAKIDRTQKEILIQPGSFQKGAAPSENKAGTPTTISRRFFMWKHEFTKAEHLLLTNTLSEWGFVQFQDANKPYLSTHYERNLRYVANLLSKHYSLPPCYTCTTPTQCEAFPQYKGEAITSCLGYRLPTENEWEYAYRAGTATDFYSGNLSARSEVKNIYLDSIGWYGYNSGGMLHDVGLKQPNAWGLYDMAGNGGEWTEGDYPRLRGGDFEDPAYECTANASTYSGEDALRVVRTAP